jgi:hypothetical protein
VTEKLKRRTQIRDLSRCLPRVSNSQFHKLLELLEGAALFPRLRHHRVDLQLSCLENFPRLNLKQPEMMKRKRLLLLRSKVSMTRAVFGASLALNKIQESHQIRPVHWLKASTLMIKFKKRHRAQCRSVLKVKGYKDLPTEMA